MPQSKMSMDKQGGLNAQGMASKPNTNASSLKLSSRHAPLADD